jgi:hypothetical protein
LFTDSAEFTAAGFASKRVFLTIANKETFCGLSMLLSLMLRIALKLPTPPVNPTVIVQLAAAARLAPQSLPVTAKFAALFPVILVLMMVNALLPVLVSTVVAELLRLVFVAPKSNSLGTICTVPFVSVMPALAVFDASVIEAAFTVTCALAGTLDGGVYVVGVALAVVVGATVPQPDVHAVPFCVMVQLACGGVAGSFTIVAVIVCNPLFTGIKAVCGFNWMVIASTVTVAEPVFVASLAATAVIVTASLFAGGGDGAVYTTELLVALLSVP